MRGGYFDSQMGCTLHLLALTAGVYSYQRDWYIRSSRPLPVLAMASSATQASKIAALYRSAGKVLCVTVASAAELYLCYPDQL